MVVDGRSPGADPDGAFVGPTNPGRRHRGHGRSPRKDIFGPVLSVIHADSLDEAIGIVNASRYGNGTSIFTESGAAVRRYRHERVEVGMIGDDARRRRSGRVLPVLRAVLRRPARPRCGRRRVLHAQEDGHDALVLGRRPLLLLRRARRASDGGPRQLHALAPPLRPAAPNPAGSTVCDMSGLAAGCRPASPSP